MYLLCGICIAHHQDQSYDPGLTLDYAQLQIPQRRYMHPHTLHYLTICEEKAREREYETDTISS